MPERSAKLAGWRMTGAALHLAISLTTGIAAGVISGLFLGWQTAVLLAWVVAAAVYLVSTWAAIWSLDGSETASMAARETPARPVRDLTMFCLSVGVVVTVVVVIFRVHQNPPERTALAVAAIAASWLVINTIFTLRLARLYFSEPRGGIDFNQGDDPTFRDFAYVAFTVGMTFQVSDTTLQTTTIRTAVLRQAVTSFVYYTVIIAVTVNIVAGLSH